MTTEISRVHVAGLADDIQRLQKEQYMLDYLEGASGWGGSSVHFEIGIRTPMDDANKPFVAMPQSLLRNLSEDDRQNLLKLLQKAQKKNVEKARDSLVKYGIEVTDPYETLEEEIHE